jgi:GNAT superfamily N-acetyltransferase
MLKIYPMFKGHTMNIRPATVEDAAGIGKVQVDSWRTTYKGIIPDDFLATLNYDSRETSWKQILTEYSHSNFVVVAEDEHGQLVGFASGGAERAGDKGFTGELYAIYLFASHQGQGIGRALMAAFAKRLKQEGMNSMLLWVAADNHPSRKFYERLGGQQVHEKTETVGGVPLVEIGYGWQDIELLIRQAGSI